MTGRPQHLTRPRASYARAAGCDMVFEISILSHERIAL